MRQNTNNLNFVAQTNTNIYQTAELKNTQTYTCTHTTQTYTRAYTQIQ